MCTAKFTVEIHPGKYPLSWEKGGRNGGPLMLTLLLPPTSQEVSYSCNHRIYSEILNNTAQGWSPCLTSVTSCCTTPMPVQMRPSVTRSSRPPGAWTDAGGTFVPCPWSGA